MENDRRICYSCLTEAVFKPKKPMSKKKPHCPCCGDVLITKEEAVGSLGRYSWETGKAHNSRVKDVIRVIEAFKKSEL